MVFHLPKVAFICQFFGQSFSNFLVVHSPKFWLFICQKIGCSFAKILVIHLPKFWSLIFEGLVHLPKVAFICQNFGNSFAKILVVHSRLSLAKILVAKQMIDIFQFLEHNHAYILPIYNQEPLTKYQLKQLTQYEQNK